MPRPQPHRSGSAPSPARVLPEGAAGCPATGHGGGGGGAPCPPPGLSGLHARLLLPALIASLLGPGAAAQVREAGFELHDRGALWETMNDDGTIGAPNPTNPFEFFPSMDWPGGPHALPSKDEQRHYSAGAGLWIGGRRADGTLSVTESGLFAYVDPGTFELIERRDNFIGAADYDPAQAEQTITARFTTTEGVRVVRTSRAWSFRGLDTQIWLEYELTNQSGGALSDVYVGFPYLLRPSYQDVVVHNGWGDDFNRTDEFVAYDAARRMVYSWDDTPNFSLPQDRGNFWDDAGELRTTGYAGVALLEAPPGVSGEAQPANVLWAQLLNNETRLTLSTTGAENFYALLSGADRSLQAAPGDHLTPFVLMSAGPYAMAPGETLRFVLVQAVNGLSIEKALEGLAAQPELTAGLDSLEASVDRAAALAARGFVATNLPPPAPELTLSPLPASRSISIAWPAIDQTWADPITGSAITEYRVYRSERSFVGPFRQIRRIRPSNTTDVASFFDAARNEWGYADNTASLGVSYFYAVTAVDQEQHQSGLTNRNEEPVTVASSPAADALNVRVFPNPFRETSGFPTTGEESTVVFNNLPARATIRLYTAAGELVRTIEHDEPASGQAAWDQLSDARQRTAPGVYFWTVTSDVGTAQGTLLLIK